MTKVEKTKCKKCESENIVFVEYSHDHPDHYDGISEIQCLECSTRFGRWSNKELAPNESEKRFGVIKKA
jgi:metal-dependent hydrolase (beta-lactamase superfamily II)